MSKPLIKSFSDLLQSFFCQRLQIQRRVSTHTLASYRDTFRLGLEFIRQKTGRTASQQQLTDWDAPNVVAFFGFPRSGLIGPCLAFSPNQNWTPSWRHYRTTPRADGGIIYSLPCSIIPAPASQKSWHCDVKTSNGDP